MTDGSAFIKAKKYVEALAQEKVSGEKEITGPCITISREAGAGSGLIANRIIASLLPFCKNPNAAWAVFDKNLIEKVIEDHNLPKQIAKFFNEEKKSFFEETMNEILGIHPPLLKLYNKSTQTILQLAIKGNCIIIGRGANLITSSLSNVFHVRLVAPLELRIMNVQEFYGNSKKEAEEFVNKEDAKRNAFIKEYFNKNASNPHLYHLVINTGQVSLDEAAFIIAKSVRIKFARYFSE